MMTIEDKLAVNKYSVDEEYAHIEVDPSCDDRTIKQALVNACPAALYRWNDDGSLRFDYAGCLECGTCRILGLDSVIAKWTYPHDEQGVEFREG